MTFLFESTLTDRSPLGQFLSFLATDMASHPDRLQPVDAGLLKHVTLLVGAIDVDE